MFIKEIKIKNFKGFKELSFSCNSSFNVIIGENNIGKSTIFEALLIWENCFNRIINSKKTGFYKADGGNSYIPFGDLTFLRLINDTDLFYEAPNKCRITLVINTKANQEFSLSFEIDKPKSISNSYLRFKTINHKEFEKFATFLKTSKISLDKSIFIYQTKPVSNILSKEPFMNDGQIIKKISLGKSGEVLRNKIVKKKGQKRVNLENQISKVLGYQVKFNCKNENRSNQDENITLEVAGLDIHLQGSGFLQVAEIFSTIDYLENAINILLIDEPDSHIHSKLQRKLLQELRLINNTQTFVISHNDNFVNELYPKELYYLNQESKDRGLISTLDIENFDKIKKDLGGIIIALDNLNYANKICFVEGDDDIEYIKLLRDKYFEINKTKEQNAEVVFYYLRGKDFLLNKLDHQKRFLSQIFKDKKYFVIYDKDFSTKLSSDSLNESVLKKLGINNSTSFKHQGYCIESTIFSNKNILVDYLSEYYSINNLRTFYFVEEYFSNLFVDFKDNTSDNYQLFEKKFSGQKNGSRPDLENVTFNDFIRDSLICHPIKIECFFNKALIKDFFSNFISHFEIDYLLVDITEEYLTSLLFKNYIDWIKCNDNFVFNNLILLETLYDIK